MTKEIDTIRTNRLLKGIANGLTVLTASRLLGLTEDYSKNLLQANIVDRYDLPVRNPLATVRAGLAHGHISGKDLVLPGEKFSLATESEWNRHIDRAERLEPVPLTIGRLLVKPGTEPHNVLLDPQSMHIASCLLACHTRAEIERQSGCGSTATSRLLDILGVRVGAQLALQLAAGAVDFGEEFKMPPIGAEISEPPSAKVQCVTINRPDYMISTVGRGVAMQTLSIETFYGLLA